MKKKIWGLFIITCLSLVLAACGLSPEEISSTMDAMKNEYQAGGYNEAYAHIETLDKAYKNMSDEQKSTYDEIKVQVEYAYNNAEDIKNKLSDVSAFIEQKLYYEANAEIEALVNNYYLPPAEQTTYDSFKSAIDEGIRIVKINNVFNAVEKEFNNNNYDGVIEKLNSLDENVMTDEEKRTRDVWRNKAEELSKLITVRTNYDNGKYSTAASILSLIDTELLNDTQREQYDKLKRDIDVVVAEIKRKQEEEKHITGEKAIELIKAEERKRHGSDIDKLKLKYSYYDKGGYYLVCATATSYADGTDKYRVYKEGGRIEFIGSGSSWASDDSEYFV